MDVSDERQSDEDDEITSVNTKKNRSSRKIVDSDSDSEVEKTELPHNTPPKSPQNDENSDAESSDNTSDQPKKSRLKIVDSDSDSEVESTKSLEKPPRNAKANNKSSDDNAHSADKPTSSSDEEMEVVTPHNKSFEEPNAVAEIYDTNSKGELVPENAALQNKKSRITDLYDSESSADEIETETANPPSPSASFNGDDETVEPIRYKRKSTKSDEPKKMTGKDAAKQRKEIQSDTQRLVREARINLPYHRPRSFSLKEFMEKRSKAKASDVPGAKQLKPSAAMKMSKDQLEIVSKKLEERLKEVQEFYKSESESEDESESASKEIRGWLDVLVDNAVNQVEEEKAKQSYSTDPVLNELFLKYSSPAVDNSPEEPKSAEPESMQYDFNLDDMEDDESERFEGRRSLQNMVIPAIQPKLSGGPDDIIDLDTGITRPSEIKKLVEKFIQHTVRKSHHKHNVHLNVISVSGGEIHEETVAMAVEDEEAPVVAVETPGAKLAKLREELQNQMAEKRYKIWQEKQTKNICPEKVLDDDCGGDADDEYLDDEEEEAEMTESEEEVEDDYEIRDEPVAKSAFVDDEADESDALEDDQGEQADDDGEGPSNPVEEAEEENNEESDEQLDQEERDTEEEPNEDENDVEAEPKKKVLKRIVKAFSDSEDDDELHVEPKEASEPKNPSCDDEIPPNLPRVDKTPRRSSEHKSDLDFLTPVSYLTGLQNLNSDSKFQKESPVFSPLRMLQDPSPLKDKNWQAGLQKKLFTELPESQQGMDEIAEICSGTFPETQAESQPSTQDLLEVCSGGFTGLTVNEDSSAATDAVSSEIKNSEEDHDQIISQLLDEDEMEQFKNKFKSPVINRPPREFLVGKEVNATGLIDSDEETDDLKVVTRKKNMKLTFSDDESGDENPTDDVSNDDSDAESEENEEKENAAMEDIAYDSEENEIEQANNLKATDFFEKEAELSESEWGSADEDEKDLDKFEAEQADNEKFDEVQVRNDLERIHLRRMLDDDTREVKLLQEMLLEDGELHGAGRQRQFRWKNIDSQKFGDDANGEDDEVYMDEEESEEQWRMMRHKREMFLKQNSQNDDVESILSESQVLRIGREAVRKSQSLNSSQNSVKTDDVKQPFNILSKRGSFLSRGDQVLQRLAEFTKVASSTNTAASKNSKGFVFQTVAQIESSDVKVGVKRKTKDGTPAAIKKLRIDELSPMGSKRTEKAPGAKKLFGNW